MKLLIYNWIFNVWMMDIEKLSFDYKKKNGFQYYKIVFIQRFIDVSNVVCVWLSDKVR